ncbi:(5-formylfuran-3-yl)methyl phosphate synthase [Archaeoglobus sp.]
MLALVSVKDVDEAKLCLNLVDILDVKNPSEGSLGASYIWTIKEVAEMSKGLVSATIGDLDKSGIASLAGYAIAGVVDFVKVGVLAEGSKAEEIVKAVVKAVNGRSKVIAVGYADYDEVNVISPFELVDVAVRCHADGVMVDTALKKKSSFEIFSYEELREFVENARSKGLMTALAGGLKWKHIKAVKEIKPDVVGVRGLVCNGNRSGQLDVSLVKRFVDHLKTPRPNKSERN